MNVVVVIWSQGEEHNECRDNCRANGIHENNIIAMSNANYLAAFKGINLPQHIAMAMRI